MRVLGVDPGSLTTGWGVLEGSASRPAWVDGGVIRLPAGLGLPARLSRLQREIEVVIGSREPAVAAVESLFHGPNARSALQLAHARGAILAALARAGLEVAEYTPATVKSAVTGNGRADKSQVRRMLARLLGRHLEEKPHDLTDALAVALCHLAASRRAAAVERAR